MITLFVRLLGTVACFFVSWMLGLATILPVVMIKDPGTKHGSGFEFKSFVPRIVAEVVSLVIGIYGIWKFPYLDEQTTRVAAIVAALAALAECASNYNKNNSK